MPTKYREELKQNNSTGNNNKEIVSILHQNTVEECMNNYTKRQVEEAIKAVIFILLGICCSIKLP